MNKKGFTTVELIVSFVMVIIMLVSLVGFTVNYRGKINEEQAKSKLIDFKNTITKIVYDDIITGKLLRITSCVGEDNCANFIDKNGQSHVLKIFYKCENDDDNSKCGTYIDYDHNYYLLPDSDMNKYEKSNNSFVVTKSVCDFNYFNIDNKSDVYSLKIGYKHYLFDETYYINLTIN